jgi:hypothetical protein
MFQITKKCQYSPFQCPSKFNQIVIFGLKTNHLATLITSCLSFVSQCYQEQILRLLNVQLQRQRCSNVLHQRKILFILKTRHAINCAVSFYNASAVKNYNATSSTVGYINNFIFSTMKKRSRLLPRWHCSCKFRSRRTGSRDQFYKTPFRPEDFLGSFFILNFWSIFHQKNNM